MINIDYYPPFMVDIRKRYTCKPMCDYLCEQWKSLINEKQLIIDLTKEYIKNKQKKYPNNYTPQSNTIVTHQENINKYVDISEFTNKYNHFVDIYNSCVDSLNDTIYHIMMSPDKYTEYYTREELQKVHTDLSNMIDNDWKLKRNKLMLEKTSYELSQKLLDILNQTDELINEIVVEILDMVELSKFFKILF